MFEWLFSKKDQGNRSTGSKMRQIRLRKGMSTADLGSKCGITDSAIRHYEGDSRLPKDDKLEEIAAALGVDVSALYDRKIESISDIMHILFEIEADGYVAPTKFPAEPLSTRTAFGVRTMNEVLNEAMEKWCEQRELWETEQISDDEYRNWQDAFPKQYEAEVHPEQKAFQTKSVIVDYRTHDLNELRKYYISMLNVIGDVDAAIARDHATNTAKTFRCFKQLLLPWMQEMITVLSKEPFMEEAPLNPDIRDMSNDKHEG